MKRFINGKESKLYIKYNDIWCPISCEVSSGISEEIEMMPTTTRQNSGGWETSKPTLQSYSIDFQGQSVYEAGENTLSYYRIREMKRTRQLVDWRRVTKAGAYIDEGTAYFTSVSDANDTGAYVTFSATLQGFGMPTYTQDIVDDDDYDCGCDDGVNTPNWAIIDITEEDN